VHARHAVMIGCCFATGCVVDTHHGHYEPGSTMVPAQPLCNTSSGQSSTVQVDADVNPPTTNPGYGAGVFVEYASGGHWRMRVICDTVVSGQGCTFDLWAQAIGAAVANVAGQGLGPNDLVGTLGTDTARLSVDTSTEIDAMTFDAPPGATVRLTMQLGGLSCVGFIFYKSGGVVTVDNVGNPVDLVPASP
jgi:hypothetical protein